MYFHILVFGFRVHVRLLLPLGVTGVRQGIMVRTKAVNLENKKLVTIDTN